MKELSGFKSDIRSQRAVFFPLAAVIGFGLLSFLFLMVGYTGRVKLAQSELRLKADLVCGFAAKQLVYDRIARNFQVQVTNLISEEALRFSELQEAVLIMPTMPEDGSFEFIDRYNPQYADVSPPVGGDSLVTFPSVSFPSCGYNADGQEICKLARSVRPYVENASTREFPLSFWNNIYNAGNSVGCKFKAKIASNLISESFLALLDDSDSEIEVKAVWWSPVRGPAPVFDALDPIGTSPGLTIAVGTELFTTSFDRRFRFKDEIANTVDPIKRVFGSNSRPRDLLSGVGNLSATDGQPQVNLPTYPPGNSNPLLNPIIPEIDRASRRFLWGSKPRSASGSEGALSEGFSFASGLSESPSERDGLLTACMNPLVLVRNTFLSAIVELASRHGQLRRMTEILHMNPMHRHESYYAPQYRPNFPVQMVGFGQDLAQPAFQLPYVFYHSGASGREFPNPANYKWFKDGLKYDRTHKNGFINPFSTQLSGVTVSGWTRGGNRNDFGVKHHALIAGQLRYCYGLYSPTGIERYGAHQNFLNQGGLFEAEPYEDHRKPTGEWQPVRSRATRSRHWDQECQYPGCNPNQQRRELLTAGELVSILGSTQMCPYSQVPPSSSANYFTSTNPPVAELSGAKPCPLTVPPVMGGYNISEAWSGNADDGYASLELIPDVAGTLNYIVDRSVGFSAGKAIRSPGLFPINANLGLPLSQSPFSEGSYVYPPANKSSPILFVLHQPMPTNDRVTLPSGGIIERDIAIKEVQEIVKAMQMARPIRPITIIYMPSTYIDHISVSTIASAFSVKLDEDTGQLEDEDGVHYSAEGHNAAPIMLFNVSPYDEFWGPLCGGPGEDASADGSSSAGGTSRTQAEIFQDYWHCLLTSDTNNITALATKVFSERIVRRELKF